MLCRDSLPVPALPPPLPPTPKKGMTIPTFGGGGGGGWGEGGGGGLGGVRGGGLGLGGRWGLGLGGERVGGGGGLVLMEKKGWMPTINCLLPDNASWKML